MAENPIKYSNVWEDANLLGKHLNIGQSDRVMSIASAGDNTLFLLSYQPQDMMCLDMNDAQIHLTRLKEEAIRSLSYESFIRFLGFAPDSQRMHTYNSLKKTLPDDTKAFFTAYQTLLQEGIVHQGKFEKYFQVFAKKVLPLIHPQERINQLFEPKSQEMQEAFYHDHWNSWRWRMFFKLFFSRFVMGRFGREPEKLKEVEEHVGSFIINQAEKHLASRSCQENYLLEYALTGGFQTFLPPFARPEVFHLIKSWLQKNRIRYFKGTLTECLDQHPKYTRFNLSNIFEYMSLDVFTENVNSLYRQASNGAKISYWNLMVPREMDEVGGFSRRPIEDNDYGFFYRQFLTYDLTK